MTLLRPDRSHLPPGVALLRDIQIPSNGCHYWCDHCKKPVVPVVIRTAAGVILNACPGCWIDGVEAWGKKENKEPLVKAVKLSELAAKSGRVTYGGVIVPGTAIVKTRPVSESRSWGNCPRKECDGSANWYCSLCETHVCLGHFAPEVKMCLACAMEVQVPDDELLEEDESENAVCMAGLGEDDESDNFTPGSS